MMTESEINRLVAKQAARGVFLYAAQAHLADLRERLLVEAKMTDAYYCTDEQMASMAEREYRKIRGARIGGYVAAAKAASKRRLQMTP